MSSRAPQENPPNQLNWTHGSSQRLNWQPRSLHETDRGPLHICCNCVTWSSCEWKQGLSLAVLPVLVKWLNGQPCLTASTTQCCQGGRDPLHTWNLSSCGFVLRTCRKSSQSRSQHGRGRSSQNLPLELLDLNGYWHQEIQLSSGTQPLRGCPCSRGCPYTCAHGSSTRKTWIK